MVLRYSVFCQSCSGGFGSVSFSQQQEQQLHVYVCCRSTFYQRVYVCVHCKEYICQGTLWVSV